MYNGIDNTYQKNGITLTRTLESDPAYQLLLDEFTTTPDDNIYRDNCYICIDPEFAQMGLPLCRKCDHCGGHVPADDSVCWDCEKEN